MPYRGQDRRGRGATAAPPAVRLLVWPALGVAVAVLAESFVWFGQAGRLAPALVLVGLLLAGAARTSARATGDAATSWLAVTGGLLAVTGGALTGQAPTGAAAVGGIAAVAALQMTRTPDVDSRLLRLRAFVIPVGVGLVGVAVGELVARGFDTAPLTAVARTFAVAAWVLAVIALVRSGRTAARPLQGTGAALAAAAGTGLGLHLAASLTDRPRLVDAGTAIALIGAAAALRGLVASLGRELEDRRSRLHVDHARSDHDAREREAAGRRAAHETRNALTGLEAANWRLRRAPEITPGIRHELGEVIASCLGRLKAILMPDQTQESGHADVADVLGAAVWFARGRGTQVVVEGVTAATAACPPSVLGQILDNLLLNAHLHGQAGTSPVTVVVTDGDRVRIDVSDQGPGIAASLGEAVFLPGTRHGVTAGEGIGLAVARDLVRAHGGEITIEPSTSGASFRVDLPAVDETVRAEGGTAEERDDHG